jgi:hypothetical protein
MANEQENKQARLSRMKLTATEVRAMSDERLEELIAGHKEDILKINGIIEASCDDLLIAKARRAVNVLVLHKKMLTREDQRRKREKLIAHEREIEEKKEAKRLAQAQMKIDADARKMARIEAANSREIVQTKMFLETVREVIGDELYVHIWQLVNSRSAGVAQ